MFKNTVGKVTSSDRRKGFSLVVGVLLLLIMAFVVAAGAYTWMDSSDESMDNNRTYGYYKLEVLINGLDCRTVPGEENGLLVLDMENNGTREVDLNPVDVEVFDPDTHEINISLSKFGISMYPSLENEDLITVENGEGFEKPGGTGKYFVRIGKSMEAGKTYKIRILFKDTINHLIYDFCEAKGGLRRVEALNFSCNEEDTVSFWLKNTGNKSIDMGNLSVKLINRSGLDAYRNSFTGFEGEKRTLKEGEKDKFLVSGLKGGISSDVRYIVNVFLANEGYYEVSGWCNS